MQRPDGDHRALPFEVHALVRDFELLDVWRFPLELADELPFEAFVAHLRGMLERGGDDGGPASFLLRVRAVIGQWTGWDDGPPLPIPGTRELSVRERLPEALAAQPTAGFGEAFDGIYATPEEALFEVSNATVHALLHLGRCPLPDRPGQWAPQMAVYARTRGWIGRAYLAAIWPFRHGIVYPSLMRAVARSWAEREGGDSRSCDRVAPPA